MGTKKDVLLAIDVNPALINEGLGSAPDEWDTPVTKSAKRIRAK